MLHILWKDRYNISYKEIDEQHKSLLAILNEMIDLLAFEPDGEAIAAIFHRLCQYALLHFETEERYMEAAGYEGFTPHQLEHASFVDRLLELNRVHDSANTQMLEETLEFVKTWFLRHIVQEDHEYIPAVKSFHARAEIKGVLLDFGSVVGRLDEGLFLERLSGICGKPAGELSILVGTSSELGRAHESGTVSSEAFLQQASVRCGRALREAEFRPAYSQVFTPNPDILMLIHSLKSHYKVGLIAETSPWRTEDVLRVLEVFPLLDSVSLSWELGAMKPSPRLWNDALAQIGFMAEECIYVDAKGAFALAATGNLLHGLTYTNPEALVKGLRRLKVQI